MSKELKTIAEIAFWASAPALVWLLCDWMVQ